LGEFLTLVSAKPIIEPESHLVGMGDFYRDRGDIEVLSLHAPRLIKPDLDASAKCGSDPSLGSGAIEKTASAAGS
jgi:hypothetical protein